MIHIFQQWEITYLCQTKLQLRRLVEFGTQSGLRLDQIHRIACLLCNL
jgi:hypothetical protein